MATGKLIMCMGLPASGKSTWAKAQVERDPKNIVRVNKDDIRAELFNKDWSHDKEKEVIRIRDFRISEALSKGKTVISDDTNFAPKHRGRLQELAKKYKALFEVKDFLDVPMEECIRRDSLREEGRVGEAVIRGMATQYLLPTVVIPPPPDPPPLKLAPPPSMINPLEHVTPEVVAQIKPTHPVVVPYQAQPGLPPAILCDLDGTLALHVGRSPYDTARCLEDRVNEPVRDVLTLFHHSKGYQIVYLSGRDDTFMDLTLTWLAGNMCPTGPIFMRAANDRRSDGIVKYELFDAHVRNHYDVKFVLDDRDRVVKVWRELGLPTFQVNDGNF
jgi:predicted kinase